MTSVQFLELFASYMYKTFLDPFNTFKLGRRVEMAIINSCKFSSATEVVLDILFRD
jgi:hypothetical protein